MRGVYLRPAPTPRMPPGLVELMQGLTRAVLQHGPRDVPRYCAEHLEQLLIIRDGRAPTKQRQTLEQKIKIAQEKVREKAEIRRRKYDEEMKNFNFDKMSAEETKQDVTSTSTNQEENPNAEKVNKPITETNLKAPVHHEQDIAESLEVEIFHKPVENVCSALHSEAKVFDECMKNDTVKQDEIKSEEFILSDTSKEKNDLVSKEKLIGNLAEAHANGLLAEMIISESISKDSEDHPRVRRDVVEQNDETNEKIQVATEINKNDVENTNEFKVELQNKKPEEAEVSSSTISENNISEINKEQPTANIETYTNNITKEGDFDLSAVSENEFTKTARVPETDFSNDDKQALNNTESSKDDQEQAPKINEKITRMDSKTPIDYERNAQDQQVEKLTETSEIEVEAVVENPPKIDALEDLQTADELKNYNEILSEIDHVTDIATDETLTTDVKSNDNQVEMHTCRVTENNELINDDREARLDESSISNENDTKTRHSEFEGEKEILSNNDEKIILDIDQLEVCSEPIADNIHKEENLDFNERLPSESEGNEHTVGVVDNKSFKDLHIVYNESITKESSDDGILEVNKVLIEELPGVRDDNDSAPEQIVDNSDADSNLHMNGKHGNTKDELMENGNESPTELEIVRIEEIYPSHDILKDSEIAETQDDVTTISEPIKTDLDTSSLGKSSSMDDSFIEDAVDSIMATERDSNDEKTTIKLAQNKQNSSSMDLETAAVTIQKVFRTFLFKSRESTFDDTGRGNSIDCDSEKSIVDFPDVAAPINKERRTLGISRMDTVLQTVNEEKSLSLSTDDSSLSSAATIIQAHVRGFLTRNRLNSNKTNSSSLVNSDGLSSTSFENDPEQKVNKTVLNIHIVPEGEHFLSRDESLLTSMELSLDGSPPSSTNLHPLGYDKSEPRKQLKREDAIQSISPPSNNSGKLSEDIDSVKDMLITDLEQEKATEDPKDEIHHDTNFDRDDTPTKSTTIETVIEAHKLAKDDSSSSEPEEKDEEKAFRRKRSLLKASSDECDVVTPYEEKSSADSDATSCLLHSGEFHDVVLPTKVSRGATSVVRGE